MVDFKCKNCGGELDFDGAGGFVCRFCGSKTFMTDEEFRANEGFRKRLLSFYRGEAEKKEFDYTTDTLWYHNGTDTFTVDDGQPLNIQYMRKQEWKNCTCYVAKESVVYVFEHEDDAERFLHGVNALRFPEADEKLPRCFPDLKLHIRLQKKGAVLAFVRRPNFYPVLLFAPLPSVHLAWVISRMENLCCALAYSGLTFGNLSPDAIWVNPITHEGALFGDWRNVSRYESVQDLKDLRKSAIVLAENAGEPKEMKQFLTSAPALNAFDDFSAWDAVIEKGFGGHKFVKM